MMDSGIKASRSGGLVIALHGFCGLPSDWVALEKRLAPYGIGDLMAPNLWSDLKNLRASFQFKLPANSPDKSPASGYGFSAWSERFLSEVAALTSTFSQKPVLMGYSMGGRLALHAITNAPELFSAAVIVSANPGLTTEGERLERLRHDQVWGQRFLTEPWDNLMREWNSQAVLAGREIQRMESDFDREILSEALEWWSLGAQPDYRADLQNLDLPILFVTGENDSKFTGLIKDLKLRPRTQHHEIIPGAGHRVPWDCPEAFCQSLSQFLKNG